MDTSHELFDFDGGSQPEPRIKHSPSPSDRAALTPPTPNMLLAQTDSKEESQTPSKPTFPYDDHKQTTGLPSNSIPGIGQDVTSYSGPFSNTGLDETSLMDSFDWPDNFDMGVGDSMDSSLFGSNNIPVVEDYVDPASITQTQEKRRAFPGMHSQQEAIQRQRQMQLQQQLQAQQQRQQPNRPHPTLQQPSDDHQKVISRIINGFRQDAQSSVGLKTGSDCGAPLHHIVRSKKEGEEMDEDEKLLASEEGKRLTSKERRQLRNKVSARAFRSRRKEYINQLESENANRQHQIDELVHRNHALLEENSKYRAFVEKLIQHPAFSPFLEDFSREFDMLPTNRNMMSAASSLPPTTSATAAFSQPPQMNQMCMPQNMGQPMPPNSGHYQVNTTFVPDMPFPDVSRLRLNNPYHPDFRVPEENMTHFTHLYAVHELPEGPSAPLDTESLSGKGHASFFPQDSPMDEVKPDYPVIDRAEPGEKAAQDHEVTVEETEDDGDPEFDLYRSSVSVSSSSSSSTSSATDNLEPVCPGSGKVPAQFELVVCNEAENERLMERFERMCAMVEPVYQRIAAMTAHLDP